eukprot:gb/GECH01002738.1/.p1 GENE.gb/GECH01002738.1/~~gb/GECH01002738.1/.p1  ORF type:complete len:460 (+),score=122.28 gb/GECH01002738.1/:1-1380(+)
MRINLHSTTKNSGVLLNSSRTISTKNVLNYRFFSTSRFLSNFTTQKQFSFHSSRIHNNRNEFLSMNTGLQSHSSYYQSRQQKSHNSFSPASFYSSSSSSKKERIQELEEANKDKNYKSQMYTAQTGLSRTELDQEAELFIQQDKPIQGIALLREAAARFGDPAAYGNLAVALENHMPAASKEALELHKVAASKDPENHTLLLNLASASIRQEKYQDALRVVKQALSIKETADTHVIAGNALNLGGRPRDAMVAFRRAVEIDPHLKFAWTELVSLKWEHESKHAGAQVLEEAREYIGDAEYYRVHAFICYQQNQILDAVKSARELHKIAPTDEEAQLNLGMLLGEAGHLEEAEQVLRDLVNQLPENNIADRMLADICFRKGKLVEARRIMQRLIANNPTDTSNYSLLGSIFTEEGKPEEALKLYRRGISDLENVDPETVQQLQRLEQLHKQFVSPKKFKN